MRSFFPHSLVTLLLAILLCSFEIPTTPLHAATLPELPELRDGQYPVGFTTIEEYDFSRTIRPAVDYFGEPMGGETARPVQICIWYPAKLTESHESLVFGEYTFPYPNDNQFFDFLSVLQDREIGRLQSVLRGDQGLVLDLLSVPVSTVADAPHADGEFPLIIYCGGRGFGIVDNLALCEHLASQGFVVAAIHSVGAASITPAVSAPDLEAVARDIEFVIATVRENNAVDKSRLGLIGRGFGGLAGLVAATRYSSINTMVTLGALVPTEEHKSLLDSHPTFSPEHLTVPLLQVFGSDAGALDTELSETLLRTERTELRDSSLSRLGLNYWGALSMLKAESAEQTNGLLRKHQAMCSLVGDFLQWRLLSDATAANVFMAGEKDKRIGANGFTVLSHAAEPGPPTSEQFTQILRERGVVTAQEVCARFGLPRPEMPLLPEYNYNAMGYERLQRGNIAEAVIVLRWGTMAYPNSANAWDSYADACLSSGDREGALRSWRKSLEVLPSDTTTDERTKIYIRANTPLRIQQLEGDG